jgi:hypothetical protein
MLNNLTNFFNIIVSKRIKTQLAPSDLIAIGTKQSLAFGHYTPTAIQFSNLQTQLGGLQTVAVDGVTITGNGTPTSPLVSTGGSGPIPIVGSLVGGGIVIDVWEENGVIKGLIASLTNLASSLPWTIPAFESTLIGPAAQSFYNGSANTSAIIAQTGLPASTSYAAGIAKLHLGGGYNDWYLPSSWEITKCYSNATIINRILGINGFPIYDQFQLPSYYWSSTENDSINGLTALGIAPITGSVYGSFKSSNTNYVRAVRIHTF